MPRRIFVIFSVVSACAIVMAPPSACASDVSHARIVRLSYAQGDVQLRAEGGSGWQRAIANTPLREGMALATGDGRAEVEFENGLTAWMASNTLVEFPQLVLEDGAKITQLTVTQGTATFYVKPGRGDSLEVEAGQMRIRAAEKARFRVDVFGDGASVSVLRGALEVDAHGATQRVNGRNTLAFRSGAAPEITLAPNPSRDAWDRWVSDRDNDLQESRDDTAAYLSAPVGYGMADLSYYGGWVDLPGYGYGWQPFGIGAGWSPFLNGYWGGCGGFGPAWISYEPWGWLPYHYGGWVYSPKFGWVWSPGNFNAWSPATVAWVRTAAGTLGWVPRGPREGTTGTPANLGRGVITAMPTGVPGRSRSRNAVLPAGANSGVRVMGDWKNDAELVRWAQQPQPAARTPVQGVPARFQAAQKMPAGPAPRIATAGSLSGRVVRYAPPVISGGSTLGRVSGAASGSAASGGAARSSGAASSGTHSGAATSSGGGGGRGRP
jgi:uncharacterized protein DUF6600/FecR-like protein